MRLSKTETPFISFDYHKINEINIDNILSKILEHFHLPDCIVEHIGSYLFPRKTQIMKMFYEKKCEDYLTTKETTFKIIKFSYYDFIVLFIKTIMFKFYELNQNVILPYMRQDVYYFSECTMRNNNFLVNKSFIRQNSQAFLVLFCEVYYTFKNCDTYFCLYGNNYVNMNKKYINYLEKIKGQIVFDCNYS